MQASNPSRAYERGEIPSCRLHPTPEGVGVRLATAVTDDRTKTIAREEGLLVGISAGAAAAAGIDDAADNPDETVVAVRPDGGERYLSTDLFNVE